MFRKIRILLAVIFFISVTWLLVDFTGTAHAYLGWMAKIQLLPALLALNIGALIFVFALTFFMGRVYCSVICPLGVMQDLIAWFRKKKNKYSYSPSKDLMRSLILALSGLFISLNMSFITAFVAPYSTYGRIVSTIVSPIYKLANNGLASVAEHFGSYAVYGVDVWMKSITALVISILTWLIIAVLAWRGGRTWCNTVCPVGTLLGIVSRHSIFKIKIKENACVNCKKCERNCKASCIDVASHTIDYSRCVMCGDCIEECNKGAISLLKSTAKCDKAKKTETTAEPSKERRAVLTSSLLLAGTALVKAQDKTTDGGFAVIEEKKKPKREKLIVPPGAQSLRNLTSHCTSCQLCVDSCPNDVLRPSTSLDRFMQPEVSYERGYCRPECNRCSEVCPTGAILPVTVEERTALQVGHAVWVKDNCLPVSEGTPCGLCARKCPAQAIQMVPMQAGVHFEGYRWVDADGKEVPRDKVLLIPVVNEEKCIGCGACENLCPSRPFSAIYVEGHDVHKEI